MGPIGKVLCVDDEPNILESFRRQLRGKFDLEITTSPKKVLDMLKSGQRFSVIVSDMRMPSMDGVELLKQVQQLSPLTVRVMLTGNAEQSTAAKAVNEGQIFRFLNKPCSAEELETVLHSAMQHYQILNAERDLLQNTLSGSIKVLSEILSLTDPVAYGWASAIREPVREMVRLLGVKNGWEVDLAAMLHSIGWVTVPEDVKIKWRNNRPLSFEEQEMVERVPELGSQFIGAIPRLQGVGRVILYCEKNYDGTGFPNDTVKATEIPEGARIIHIAQALVKMESNGLARENALKALWGRPSEFDNEMISILLGEYAGDSTFVKAKEQNGFPIEPEELCPGQRLTEHLYCADGKLLMNSGAYLSQMLCKSIQNYAQSGNLRLPIMVDARLPEHLEGTKR